MTLVELLVASAVFVLIIAAAGYVYAHTSEAVALASARIQVNAKVRAVARRVQNDLQGFTPDGLLILAAPGPAAVPGANPSGILMFTASGRFESRTQRDASGRPVTANAALIAYVTAKAADGGSVLCRYVYLLTGDRTRWPATVAALAETAEPGDANPLANSDVLGDSLADVRGLYAQGGMGAITTHYLDPLLAIRTINTAPTRTDDPDAGGVVQLWPYLVGGCSGFRVEFHDGFAADGVTPSAAPLEWFAPDSEAARQRYDQHGQSRRRFRQGVACVFWPAPVPGQHPQALRLTFSFQDVRGRVPPRNYEIIVPLP